MIDEAVLDRAPLLRALNARARRELAARSILLTRQAGELFWRAGDGASGLIILLSGSVRVVRTGRDGRTQVIHRESAGAILGEVAVLDGGGYPATAVAEETATAILVTTDALEAAMAADAALARALLESLAGRVRRLVDRVESLAMLDVRSRLARHLLDRADAAAGDVFDLGTTHALLAADLGTVREVIVRTLGDLRRRGVLAGERRGRYSVRNRAALETLADR